MSQKVVVVHKFFTVVIPTWLTVLMSLPHNAGIAHVMHIGFAGGNGKMQKDMETLVSGWIMHL